MAISDNAAASAPNRGTAGEVFGAFLKLGFTAFGGPVAHLAYFREEFVARRGWLSDGAYADLVALCQFMPGPASSQVGLAIGLSRAGGLGAFAAWTAFTLPSAILLTVFALGVGAYGDAAGSGWLAGLKLVALAVVAQALLGMARSLCPDAPRASIAVLGLAAALLAPGVVGQLAAIGLGLIGGLAVLNAAARSALADGAEDLPIRIPAWMGALALASLAVVLFGSPTLVAAARATGHDSAQALVYFDSFFRSGALVFGGGHVVLPLLEAEMVEPGFVTRDAFLAGYGAAQAVPGPLFTFAAFLGASTEAAPTGVAGAAIALVAIFLPSAFLVIGLLPFWSMLRRAPLARAGLLGVNAAVVGLLGAALYDPVFTAAVDTGSDVALAVAAFVMLTAWRTPPWIVVIIGAIAGAALAAGEPWLQSLGLAV